jgi:uncharacterized RDD family membrane protein YckC
MQIYLSRHGQRVGPFTLEEINRQLASGTLSAADLGWSESSPGWKPILSFTGVIMPGGASSTAAPVSLATPIAWGLPEYAGFWLRAWAFLIDTVIVMIFALAIGTILRRSPSEPLTPSASGAIAQALFLLLYMPVLWASPMQATAGQRICRVRVVDGISSEGISFGQGLLRLMAMALSGLLLGIGFLMAAFTERKRGLHDMLADTCVIKDSLTGRWRDSVGGTR